MRAVAGGKLVALVVEHLAGQPDRRQWRAQLVRDIRDETLLHPRQVGELPDLALQAVRHAVERAGERRELVVALFRQSLLQLPAASFSLVSAATRTGPTTSRTTR